MRKFFFALLFLSSLPLVQAQAVKDASGNLIGYIQKSDLLDRKDQGWFKSKNYEDYSPDNKTIQRIKKSLKNVTIMSFFGTWCHDSKRVIPRFYKIMESAGFDLENNFQMIGVSRGKRAPNNLHENHNLERTPTIIFLKNGKEIGRFVEHARETIEKDILKILKQKNYKHAYQK